MLPLADLSVGRRLPDTIIRLIRLGDINQLVVKIDADFITLAGPAREVDIALVVILDDLEGKRPLIDTLAVGAALQNLTAIGCFTRHKHRKRLVLLAICAILGKLPLPLPLRRFGNNQDHDIIGCHLDTAVRQGFQQVQFPGTGGKGPFRHHDPFAVPVGLGPPDDLSIVTNHDLGAWRGAACDDTVSARIDTDDIEGGRRQTGIGGGNTTPFFLCRARAHLIVELLRCGSLFLDSQCIAISFCIVRLVGFGARRLVGGLGGRFNLGAGHRLNRVVPLKHVPKRARHEGHDYTDTNEVRTTHALRLRLDGCSVHTRWPGDACRKYYMPDSA